jgi:hypothetical protein
MSLYSCFPHPQGSGWGWLAYDPKAKGLKVATTANQDPLHATTGLVPLLGVDVWCARAGRWPVCLGQTWDRRVSATVARLVMAFWLAPFVAV